MSQSDDQVANIPWSACKLIWSVYNIIRNVVYLKQIAKRHNITWQTTHRALDHVPQDPPYVDHLGEPDASFRVNLVFLCIGTFVNECDDAAAAAAAAAAASADIDVAATSMPHRLSPMKYRGCTVLGGVWRLDRFWTSNNGSSIQRC